MSFIYNCAMYCSTIMSLELSTAVTTRYVFLVSLLILDRLKQVDVCMYMAIWTLSQTLVGWHTDKHWSKFITHMLCYRMFINCSDTAETVQETYLNFF